MAQDDRQPDKEKQQVKQFLLDYDKALGDNILTSSDWDYLEKTHAFLQPFTSTTLWAQGVTATLSQNLILMDILLRHYEQKKELYEAEETHDPLMLHSIDMGWFVLDKYYALSGSPLSTQLPFSLIRRSERDTLK
ncbi:hypothetical protein NW765_017326 [Fusarium oxysporum]|nr:hypothetical protein NW765_017326 [Fusarium oxysporum]